MKKYFSVGEAAKAVRVTSETLRHYDRIGLVKPSKKDEWTHYRYYTEEDLDGLIAFYESPLGKKMASTQPLILKEVMGVVPQWAAEFGSKMSEIVKSAKIQTQP